MSQAIKVGIFATLSLLVLGYLILKVEDLELFSPEGRRVDVLFDSVAGLDVKSAVRVAGVRVGKVDEIVLEGSRARVKLLLTTPVEITRESSATIANLGLLGDKYVELILSPAGQPLGEGEALIGQSPFTIDQAIARLNEVAGSVQDVTSSVAGTGGSTSISRLLDNLERTSEVIEQLILANRAQVDSTVGNIQSMSAALAVELPRLTDQMGQLLAEVRAVVADNRGSLSGSLANVETLTASLQGSIDNLDQISGKIARGEGTIGKLIGSEEAHDQLVSTLGSVEAGVANLSDVFTKVQKLKLNLGFEGYYLAESKDSRTAFSVEIDPQSDRFYLIEAVDDPRGRRSVRTDTVTVTEPDGTSDTTTTRRLTVEDDIAVSAQFGFDLKNARLRGGLIESTGGAGIDYDFLESRLRLSFEAFDFGREELSGELDPRLRFMARYNVSPNVYILGGWDDVLVSDQESIFFGAGVRWSDDDLKYLLGSVPSF